MSDTAAEQMDKDVTDELGKVNHQTMGEVIHTNLPFYESMTKGYISDKYTVRVWRRETEIRTYPDEHVLRAIWDCNENDSVSEIMDKIALLPRIAAIEVTSPGGCGVVAYLEW